MANQRPSSFMSLSWAWILLTRRLWYGPCIRDALVPKLNSLTFRPMQLTSSSPRPGRTTDCVCPRTWQVDTDCWKWSGSRICGVQIHFSRTRNQWHSRRWPFRWVLRLNGWDKDNEILICLFPRIITCGSIKIRRSSTWSSWLSDCPAPWTSLSTRMTPRSASCKWRVVSRKNLPCN